MSLQCCRNPINFIKSNCSALQRLIDNVDLIINSSTDELSESNITYVTTVIGDGENTSLIELSLVQQALGFNTSHMISYILKRADSLVELWVTDFSGDTGTEITANLSGAANVPNSHHLKVMFLK